MKFDEKLKNKFLLSKGLNFLNYFIFKSKNKIYKKIKNHIQVIL